MKKIFTITLFVFLFGTFYFDKYPVFAAPSGGCKAGDECELGGQCDTACVDAGFPRESSYCNYSVVADACFCIEPMPPDTCGSDDCTLSSACGAGGECKSDEKCVSTADGNRCQHDDACNSPAPTDECTKRGACHADANSCPNNHFCKKGPQGNNICVLDDGTHCTAAGACSPINSCGTATQGHLGELCVPEGADYKTVWREAGCLYTTGALYETLEECRAGCSWGPHECCPALSGCTPDGCGVDAGCAPQEKCISMGGNWTCSPGWHPDCLGSGCTPIGACGGQGGSDCEEIDRCVLDNTYGVGICEWDESCRNIPDPIDPPKPVGLVYTGPIIDSLEKIIGPVAKMLYYGGLAIGVLFIILSGYKIMVSEGDPQRVKAAQEQLTSAILGIIFILLSVTIIRIIMNTIVNI